MKTHDDAPLTPEQFVLRRRKRARSEKFRDESKMIRPMLRSRMTACDMIEAMMQAGISLGSIAKASGISATTLRLHIQRGQPMSPKNAKIFAQWSGGQVSAIKMFVEGHVA